VDEKHVQNLTLREQIRVYIDQESLGGPSAPCSIERSDINTTHCELDRFERFAIIAIGLFVFFPSI
jgi:hypothetical protein